MVNRKMLPKVEGYHPIPMPFAAAASVVEEPGLASAVVEPGLASAVVEPGLASAVVEPGLASAVVEPGLASAVVEPGSNLRVGCASLSHLQSKSSSTVVACFRFPS
jgi:hypothetical protein